MRIALGIALIMMVISEMIAATSGLGYLILQAQRTYAIAQMYAGIIVLGLLGWLATTLFALVERRVLSWYQEQRGIARG
jgi:ABC-type nitrate/sulfonate/bicarbonate transport system permease component